MPTIRHLPTDVLSLISAFLLPEHRTSLIVALSTSGQRVRTLPQHRLPPRLDLCPNGPDLFAGQILPSWLACLQLSLSTLNLSPKTRETLLQIRNAAAALMWRAPDDFLPSAAWQDRLSSAWQAAPRILQNLTLNLQGQRYILRTDVPLLSILLDWSATALVQLTLRMPASWVDLVQWPIGLRRVDLSLCDFCSSKIPILNFATAPHLTVLGLVWSPIVHWAAPLPPKLKNLFLMEWQPQHPLPSGLQKFRADNIVPASHWASVPLSLANVEMICPREDHPGHLSYHVRPPQSDRLLEWLQPLQLQSLSVTNFHPTRPWDLMTLAVTMSWSSPLFEPRLHGLTKLTITASQADIHVIGQQCRGLTDLTIVDWTNWDSPLSAPFINIPSLIRLHCPYASQLDLTLLLYLETLCLTRLPKQGQMNWPNIVQLPHASVICSYVPDPTYHNPPDGGLICAGVSIPCPPVTVAFSHPIPAVAWFPKVE